MMRNFWNPGRLLDYIFVESCRNCRQLIPEEDSEVKTLCRECWSCLQKQKAEVDVCGGIQPIRVAHAVTYDGPAKILIHRLKYSQDRLVARDLSALLFRAYLAIQEEINDPTRAVLLPVPLSRWRKISRGFNQSELIARHIRKQTAIPIREDLLVRQKNTRPQHRLNKLERTQNLHDAFKSMRLRDLAQGTTIILVDDVHTSGATLSEAARTLREGGAGRILAITVARAILSQNNNEGIENT